MNEMHTKVRNLAIELLDDGHGINEPAFLELHKLLVLTENEDVAKAVVADGGRYFIGEVEAEALRAVN